MDDAGPDWNAAILTVIKRVVAAAHHVNERVIVVPGLNAAENRELARRLSTIAGEIDRLRVRQTEMMTGTQVRFHHAVVRVEESLNRMQL